MDLPIKAWIALDSWGNIIGISRVSERDLLSRLDMNIQCPYVSAVTITQGHAPPDNMDVE